MEEILTINAPTDVPRVLMIFDGILIASATTPSVYQIGVVPAADHQFSIMVTEFQKEVTSEGDVFSPILSRQITFADFPPANKNWSFEVNQKQPPAPASGFDSGEKPKRFVTPTPPKDKDHRWPLGLDDAADFPGHGSLTKQLGVLNPIINFKNGQFYTRALTEAAIGIFRKADGEGREKLGVISKQFAANIEDIQDDGQILLKDGADQEVFKLVLKKDRRFSIVFQNTPPHLHPAGPGIRSHFPLYYAAFTPKDKRYDLVFKSDGFPGHSIPDPDNPTGGFGAPDPFRCGPVQVNATLG